MTDPIWSWSAVTAVDRLRQGKISPREMLASIRTRVETVDPIVNALPTLCFDRAERFAAILEDKPAAERGYFAGLPWPIKDSVAVAGVRTTYGSLAYAENVPQVSDYVVEAIEAEGGVVFAKSNTPEFEAGSNTFNSVFGRTLNPWNLSRSAGGSSGGAAVAVATGMAFLAQGSDFACSLRYPAAFCNVVGIRPSPGLVPQGPSALPFQVLSVIGPLARNVPDVALALDGMARFEPRDPLSRACAVGSFLAASQAPRRPYRAALSMTLGLAAVDRAVQDTVCEAVGQLASAGLAIEETQPDLTNCDRTFRILRGFQFAALWHEAHRHHRNKLKPEVIWNIEEGLKLSAAEISEAEAERARLRLRMLDFLNTHGVLITPTAPVEPFPVAQRYVDTIDGQKLATYLDWLILGYAITVCGCPAISIPCGRSTNGLPVGLQLIGRPYREAELLSVAAWCEGTLNHSLTRPIGPNTLH